MIIKYRASFYSTPKIERCEFERETDKFLVSKNGRRDAKVSTNDAYYSTWEQARDALIMLHEQRVAQARRSLEVESSHLGNIKGWKNPESV